MNEGMKRYLQGASKKDLYKDINYDPNGIDYRRFIKLRLTTYDKKYNYIKQYTIEGFRLLCFLMTRATKTKYITTTINILIGQLDTTKYKTIKAINKLVECNVIEVYNNKNKALKEIMELNTPINILIKYNDDELYKIDNMNGYKAIPLDFMYRAVTDLNDKEFNMLMFLIVRFRYYYIAEYVDEETGEYKKALKDIRYSFPTQEDIAEVLQCNRNDIKDITKELKTKGYIKANNVNEKISIYDSKLNKQIIRNKNITYDIKLLNRNEYIYNQIILVADKEHLKDEVIQDINNLKVDDLLIRYENDKDLNIIYKNKLYLESILGKDNIKNYYNNYKREGEEDQKDA